MEVPGKEGEEDRNGGGWITSRTIKVGKDAEYEEEYFLDLCVSRREIATTAYLACWVRVTLTQPQPTWPVGLGLP